jgi:hypothetical protein
VVDLAQPVVAALDPDDYVSKEQAGSAPGKASVPLLI